jgi:hypothetical protein
MPDYGDERGFQRRPNMRDVAGPVQRGPIDSGDYFQQGPTPVDVPMRGGGGGQPSNLGGDPFARRPWQGDEGGFDPFERRPWQGDAGGFDPFERRPWQGEEGGFDPFDPVNLGMGSGEYLSGMYGGGLDDVAGMNGDARGMLEGAGFDVAGKTTDERVVEKLWGRAVNALPIGSPDTLIQQEHERLKQIYYEGKYGSPGGGGTSSALPIGPMG